MKNNLLLILILVIFSCAKYENVSIKKETQPITTIKNFSEINMKNIDSKTLILIDIDNTIFSAENNYGSVAFFGKMLEDEMMKYNITKSQAAIKVYDRWIKSQKNIKTILVDEKIHDFIDQARRKGSIIIAFTARQSSIAEITYNQLLIHNIDFDKLPNLEFKKIYKNQIFPDEAWCKNQIEFKNCINDNILYNDSESLFYKGILFSHDLNKKGKIFQDFYQTYAKYLENNKKLLPEKLIFIDDGLHNVESLQDAAKKLNIKFYGYHIDNIFSFDPVQAYEEEKLGQYR